MRGESVLRHHLAMQVDIEAFDLDRLAHPHPRQEIDDDENDEGGHSRPGEGHGNAFDLRPDLADIAFESALGAADRLDREYAGQDGADDAADAVHPEHVKRVVVTEGALDRGRGKEATDSRRRADAPRADQTSTAQGR